MNIHEAGENYLEQVLMISLRKSNVRQSDVCSALGYSRPTVSVTLRELAQAGYLDIDEAGNITLTEAGRAVAEPIYERHCVIAEFLMSLGTCEETAYSDACKIEHDISEESYRNIKKYYREQNGKK